METMANPADDGQSMVSVASTCTIRRTAEERFRGSAYLALRGIACVVRGDAVHLHGQVPSYFLKQLAQELVAGVEGVRRVINRIEVLRPSGPGAG